MTLLCMNGVVEFVYDVSMSGFRFLGCGSKVDISRGSQAHWIVPMYRLMYVLGKRQSAVCSCSARLSTSLLHIYASAWLADTGSVTIWTN